MELNADAIPIHPGAKKDGVSLAWSGGEDYELFFAVPRKRTRLFLAAVRQAGETHVTEIGVCTKGREVCAIAGGTRSPLPEGFEHF